MGFFGIGIYSITFMGWLFAIVAIIINTTTGFEEVDKRIYPKVGKSLRLSRSQIFLRIYFPGATPYLFTGLKLGFIYSIIGVIASEFILSTKGLGYLVKFSYSAFETEIMYASMLLVVIIAVLINSALMRMEAWLYGRQAEMIMRRKGERWIKLGVIAVPVLMIVLWQFGSMFLGQLFCHRP